MVQHLKMQHVYHEIFVATCMSYLKSFCGNGPAGLTVEYYVSPYSLNKWYAEYLRNHTRWCHHSRHKETVCCKYSVISFLSTL